MAKGVRGSDQFQIRLPNGMRDRIKAVADRNNRSMNAEIVATLEDKYPEPEPAFQALFDLYHLYAMNLISDKDVEKLPEKSKSLFKYWIKARLFEVSGFSPDQEVLRSSAEHIMHKRGLDNPWDLQNFLLSIRDPVLEVEE